MAKVTVQHCNRYHKRRRNADVATPVFYRCRLLLFSILAVCLATVFIVFPSSSNLDLLDDGSVFAPITARKVASKWRGYLSSNVNSGPTGRPKLYFPRYCPSSNRSCAIMVPSFIMAGGEASGTQYIFDTLSKHPQIVGTVDHERTEVLFDLDMRDDTALYETYLSEFPLVHDALRTSIDSSDEVVVGEHAPQYLYKSHVAARRLRELLPHVKLVFVLRDPIDRAYIHYVNDQDQVSSFETLIDKELDILRQCVRTTVGWEEFVRCHQSSEIQASRELDFTISTLNDTHESTNSSSPTYDLLARGMYYTALLPFLEQFPASQILIFRTEDFLNNPSASFQKLARYLGIDPTFFSERNFYRNQAVSDPTTALHPHISSGNRRHGSLRHGRVSALAMEDEVDESTLEPLWSAPPETTLTDLEMRYRLQKIFGNLNARLLELFNDDFPGWVYDVDKG